MNSFNFRGTGVALVTSMMPDGKVDEKSATKVIEHVISGGVDYLVPLGTTGEAVTLSDDEQDKFLDIVFAVNNGRLPVVIGCGGNNTLAVAKRMEALQKKYIFEGFLSVTPYYNKPSQEGLSQHYKVLSKSANLPIMLYNVPARTNVNMLPKTVVEIANSCKNIIAIKEASGSLDQGIEIVHNAPEGFITVSGDDAMAVGSIACGFQGVVSVLANVLPKQTGTMIKAALENDFLKARTYLLKLYPLIQLLFSEGNPAGIKAALEEMNLGWRAVRPPLVPASYELAQKMASYLADLQKLE
jgi:4-hydroxy-tetrahydrodipicolinate synthase